MMDERFERIETKLLAAEDQLEVLNRLVWRQQEELALLREQLRQLVVQLRASGVAGVEGTDGGRRAEDEIPPHW